MILVCSTYATLTAVTAMTTVNAMTAVNAMTTVTAMIVLTVVNVVNAALNVVTYVVVYVNNSNKV